VLAEEPLAYLAKALQNLAVADVALESRHFDAAASRAYYAAFQAAVAALWVEGIRASHEAAGTLSHTAVQSEWSGRLVYRRKLYPPELRTTLYRLYDWRIRADYHSVSVTARQAQQASRESRLMVEHISARLGVTGT
jgi:uncharacterized protein (UPF0332 family)